MRRGFTLLELLLVVTVTGLIALITVPRMSGALDGLTADYLARRLAAAHARARIAALLDTRTAFVRATAAEFAVGTVRGTDTTIVWRAAGPAAEGGLLAGPARDVAYAPTGFPIGAANGTWTVTYRSAVRDIVVSRLGRVRVVRP